MKRIPLRSKTSLLYRATATILRMILAPITRKDWSGGEHLPATGGFIAVSNHATYADPLTFAHFLYLHGYPPHFLAKSQLFEIPVVGKMLRNLNQIPVHRGSVRAKDAVDEGMQVLEQGGMIAIFPEGTLTRDPDLWPMEARTGVARMALEAGVPVVPVAQWGAHRLLGHYEKVLKPFPPKKITMVAGPPIDLDDLRARHLDQETMRLATDRIMDTLTSMVEDIRGEKAPAERYDMRKHKKKST